LEELGANLVVLKIKEMIFDAEVNLGAKLGGAGGDIYSENK
jgi:hypothetical protein